MPRLQLTPADAARYAAVRAEARAAGPRPDPTPPRKRVAGRPPTPRRAGEPNAADARFAEKVLDRFDPGEVVGSADAADAAGEPVATARNRIARLKAARSWPYRSPLSLSWPWPRTEGGAA